MADDATVGKVNVELTGDAKPLEDAAKRGGAALRALGESSSTSSKSLSTMGVAAGTTAGILSAELVKAALNAAASIATFAHSVTKAASQSVESMDFIAQATGLTLQQLQMLEPVFARNGMAAEQMGNVFRILAIKMQEARDPTSQAGQALNELGLSLTGLESPSEVFSLIAQRISTLPDGFQKTRLETELLGRSGAKMSAVLNEGADGLKRSGEEALKMGNVLNTDANNALLKVNDSFDNLTVAQGNLSKHLAVFFAPFIQSANEAQLAMTNWGVKIVDEMTIASRTLAVRFQALWGFIKAQAELNLSDIGKIPELFTRWDDWAKEQIENIRRLGVTAKEAGEQGVGKIDEKAQAAARSAAKMTERFFFGLTQVDIGWKIVQESITAYGRSQEALGKFITDQLIQAYKDLRTTSELWSKSNFEGSKRSIDQYVAMESALRGVALAGNQAALAGGRISGPQFSERTGQLAIEDIDTQIQAQQRLLDAIAQRFASALTLASEDANKQRELIQQNLAEVQTANNQIEILQQNRIAKGIENSSAITQSQQRMYDTNLAAAASTANAEVRILEGQYAFSDELRTAKLNAIQANLDRELAAVGLTEQQKLAIERNAMADRIGIARQYPDFFQKQMQDLVAGNAFSLSQMSTQFTNATAQWIVTGKGFEQFWTQLQVTLVQGFLNSLVQMLAQWILHSTTMEAAATAFEAAKTATFGTGEASRLVIAKATGIAMAAMLVTQLGAMMAIGQAAIAIAVSVAETIAGILYAAATAAALIPGGQGIAGSLIAGATVLSFGAATAAIAGTAAIQASAGAAIVALGTAAAFASGGIVTGPTLGMIGEAGASEAIIPLNQQGAGFMADMLGMGGSQQSNRTQIISLDIDGSSFRRWILRGAPDEIRLRAGAIA